MSSGLIAVSSPSGMSDTLVARRLSIVLRRIARSPTYAWQDNPDCNLYNAGGLPASPFRTDDWPVPTLCGHSRPGR